jgi:hypothetical protein
VVREIVLVLQQVVVEAAVVLVLPAFAPTLAFADYADRSVGHCDDRCADVDARDDDVLYVVD